LNLDVAILRIKALCPLFSGNVAGAAEYQKGVHDQAWLPTPAAYVIPLDDEAQENADLQGVDQVTIERIGVIVMFSNAVGVATGDRRGQTTSQQFNPIKWQLRSALLNWRPNSSQDNPGVVLPTDPGADHSARGFYAGSGRLIDFDLARLFYQWEFALEVKISDADGSWPPVTAEFEQMWLVAIKNFLAGQGQAGKSVKTVLGKMSAEMPPDDRIL
jgi:hypothetical protein